MAHSLKQSGPTLNGWGQLVIKIEAASYAARERLLSNSSSISRPWSTHIHTLGRNLTHTHVIELLNSLTLVGLSRVNVTLGVDRE